MRCELALIIGTHPGAGIYDAELAGDFDWPQERLRDALDAYADVCRQLVRLRVGGWHMRMDSCSLAGDNLQMLTPLDVAQRHFFGTELRVGLSPTAKRACKRLARLADALAKLPPTPRRADGTEVAAQVAALDEYEPHPAELAELAQARWPELDGPFLAAVIERAHDLMARRGISATHAVERAGRMPLAGHTDPGGAS